MRILHLTDNLVLGGSQQVLIDLTDELVGRGHEVGVAAGDGDLWDDLSPQVRRFRYHGARLGHRQIRWIRQLLAEHPWDIVHTHQRGVSTAVWLTRRGLGSSHVEHVHTTFPVTATKSLSFRGDRLIACGSEVARMLVEDFGRSPARVRTIPNGVHDHGVRRSTDHATGGPLRIVNIARVDHQKDPARFVETIRALAARDVRVTATWIGDGALLEDCRRMVADYGLGDVLVFLGSRRPAVGLLADADVLLLTSRYEGLPLSVLEAGAAACAVMAPDVGSLSDVIEHGHNGWLYPSGAGPDEIAALLADAGSSAGVWDEVGRHGREIYERSFDVPRVAGQVEEVYREVCVRPGSA